MRLPSRIGTITLRSMTAMVSSSCSVEARLARASLVIGAPGWACAPAIRVSAMPPARAAIRIEAGASFLVGIGIRPVYRLCMIGMRGRIPAMIYRRKGPALAPFYGRMAPGRFTFSRFENRAVNGLARVSHARLAAMTVSGETSEPLFSSHSVCTNCAEPIPAGVLSAQASNGSFRLMDEFSGPPNAG